MRRKSLLLAALCFTLLPLSLKATPQTACYKQCLLDNPCPPDDQFCGQVTIETCRCNCGLYCP